VEIKQSFSVARDPTQVWAILQDVQSVAACMPGAELLADKGDGLYSGRVGIKLGPFSASFEGDAQLTANAAERAGHLEGKGVDKRGGSRSKLVLDYRLSPSGEGTRVDIDADIQLSGPIAQFGRTGIINETANVLIRQFAQNVEAKLTALPSAAVADASTTPPSREGENKIGVIALLGAVIASFLRRLFRRHDSAKE
jgi:carbon-monoxide dehydrogenase small subunit